DADKNSGGVLKTIDAGANWTVQTTHRMALAVYYHAPSSTLFLSTSAPGQATPIKKSVDDGDNWTDVVSPNNRVRYSFWDANTGLVGTAPVTATDDQVARTIDGGNTWSEIDLDTSAIFYTDQPLAVPNTNLGFLVGRFTENNDYHTYRTTDKGITWKKVFNFPTNPWRATTHMKSTCSFIYMQGEDGLYYSTSQGDSWINTSGPTTQNGSVFLKQFDFGLQFIWASDDQNNLWNFPIPSVPNQTRLRIDRRALRINSTSCTPVDSSFFVSLANFCDNFQITGLQLTGSPEITLKNAPVLPYTMGGRDSLSFSYASPDFTRDSATIKISYTVNGVPFDTVVVIAAERTRQLNAQLSFQTMKKEVAQACIKLDTTFSILNTPCDQLRILSVKLTDSSLFRIQKPGLPFDLGPDAKADIRITAEASVQGTYTSKLMVKFEFGGQIFDTTIPLEYKVKTGPLAPVIPAMNFVLDNPCTKLDTVVRWLNRLCNDLTLDSITVEPNKGVSLRSPAPLPTLPTEILRYPITIQGAAKGKYTAKVKLSFTDQQGFHFDTTITITYEVKNGLPTKINQPASFTFRATSICAPRQQTLYIENTLCDPITLTSQSWLTANPTITIVSQPAPDVVLAPGAKDSVVLQFAPTAAGNQAATLRIDYRVQATTQFAQVSVNGVGTTQANAALTDELLVFDSSYSCEAVPERFTHITNEGCDSISITSLSQLAGNDFTVVEPTIPFKLGPGDSIKIVLRPKGRVGALGDSIDLVYRSLSGGADQAARLRLQGFTRPPVRLVEMATAFTFNNIPPCTTKDSTIRIYNNGICDTLIINSVNATGLGGVTTNATTPIRIAPGEFYDIQIVMNTGTAGINGTATVRILGNIDTTFTVAVTTSTGGGGGESTLSVNAPVTTFNVPPCGTETNTFSFTAQGCGDFTLARVALESTFPGQTQFTLAGPAPGVMTPGTTVNYTVTFDASGNGNNTVDLVIESADGKFVRRIPLTAMVTGSTGVFSLRLVGEGGSNSFTKAPGEKVNVEFFSDQNVDGGLNLSEVAFDLAYDIDVMSSTASNGANGWNISAQATATGTRIVFTKAPGTPHNVAQPLGNVEYTVRLAEEKTTQLTIGDPTLNGGDAEYVRCILRPQPSSGSVGVNVTTDLCDDDMIRDAMAGREFLKIIAVKPSNVLSASSLSDVSIDYVLAAESSVMISVQDQLGRVIAQQNAQRNAGTHAESLKLPAVEGIYFVTIQTPKGGTETRKIVIE
ncbi:MAG TPA: choice-of-anchor D domain-containing protein, partial [Candidatus Kapabacteria bacterium]|nr:choice-of-anchor D domain-containing protein [Candidatus Kapabacteria bacterium]